MRNFSVILFLGAVLASAAAYGQGTVAPANTVTTLMRTNAIAFGLGSGNTSPAGGGFVYEVLTAPSTVTSVDSSLQQLFSAPWSDTGVRMTNTTLASGGRLSSAMGTSFPVANNWPGGQSNSFIVVGWSANLGLTWAVASSYLFGSVFTPQNGGFYFEAPHVFFPGAFIGATTVGVRSAGLPDGTGAPSLFATGPDAQGVPVTTPTFLYPIVTTPEPSFAALAGCGTIAWLARRRRGA